VFGDGVGGRRPRGGTAATWGDGLTHAGETWPGDRWRRQHPSRGVRRKLTDGGDWKNGIFAAGMEKDDLLKYCRFYKGEQSNPYGRDDAKALLWVAEEMICNYFDEFRSSLTDENAGERIPEFVEAYIGKWRPFESEEFMRTYRQQTNKNQRAKVHFSGDFVTVLSLVTNCPLVLF